MNAIEIRQVHKKFRKVSVRRNYGTLKSLFVEMLRGRGARKGEDGAETFEALKGIDIAVPKGETWGVIGRNGSGKSTLLKLIAGIYRPDGGSVNIEGRVSALIELGAGFHPDFSGRENVFINASILGMPRREVEEKFDEIVRFAELEEFIDNPVRTYSSGMFMRLGFSVAVHVDPDVLLVDEVLAVGDEVFGHKCKEKMDAFKKAGKTILIVTHDLSTVERWCDGAVWLDRGVVKMTGRPERVVDAYLAEVAEGENAAHLAAPAEEPSTLFGTRWGTREVEITSVLFFDGGGQERYVYHSGDPVTVRIGYTAHQPVEEPAFGILIHSNDGVHLYGTNTDLEGYRIDRLEGSGTLTLTFDRMELVEGSYRVTVAVHARDHHAFDWHDQMYEFAVRARIKEVGIYRPPHRWSLDGAPLARLVADAD